MTDGPDAVPGDGPTPPSGSLPPDAPHSEEVRSPEGARGSGEASGSQGARPSEGAVPPRGDAPDAPGKGASRTGRELVAWLALTALGCALVLFASTRTWVSDVRAEGAPGGAGGLVAPTGGELGPVLVPVALAGLAGVVAALAARGVARRLIGALVALCGLVAGLATWPATGGEATAVWLREHNVLHGLGELRWDLVPLWPALSWLGAALMVAGGVIAMLRGGRWAGMSGRYEREPARGKPDTTGDRALWEALDRGDDPT